MERNILSQACYAVGLVHEWHGRMHEARFIARSLSVKQQKEECRANSGKCMVSNQLSSSNVIYTYRPYCMF